MALDDQALFTAAKGYIYVATVGQAAPSAANVTSFDPAVFGKEQQTLTTTGTPTGGVFTITFGGDETADIAYNATASAVQSALEALDSVGVGGATVTGGPGPGSPWVITFHVAGNPAQVTVDSTGLTGGTTPTITPTTSTAFLGWESLGHTSRDDLPEFGFDGGEAETRGTWQNDALKEVITEALVDYVTFNLHQFDETGLALYYGQDNSGSAAAGEFRVDNAPTSATERSLLMVVVDGDTKIAFYCRKASLRRGDSIGMEVDGFAVLPIRATFLKDGNNELFRWISETVPVNPA